MDDAIVEQVVDRLRELVAVPSVVGYEGPLMDLLADRLEKAGLQVRAADGVVVGSGTAAGRVVVSAHADRHGLVCTGPGSFGYAAHVLPAIRGQLKRHRHAYAKTVCTRFEAEDLRAYDPQTGRIVADGRVDHMAVCGVDDLGIAVPVQGLDHVIMATPVAFDGRVSRNGDRVSAQLDNVLGVAMCLVLAETGFQGTIVFTREEEVGGSWRYLNRELLRHVERPETLLVIDTSPFDDAEAVDAGAVVLRWSDATATFDIPQVSVLIAIAQARGIPVVVKDRLIARLDEERRAAGLPEEGLGRTELGRLVRGTGGWANGATLQVPTTNYHTNAETTSARAIGNAMAVLLEATRT